MAPTAQSNPQEGAPLMAPTNMHSRINTPIDAGNFQPHHLSMPTNFRQMVHSGSMLLGTCTRFPTADAARVIATLPHQWCFVDAEHTPLDANSLSTVIRTIQFVSNGRMVPVVRVPEKATHLITYALNAGAGGIVMPHVRNAEQAKAVVDLCRFPPNGHRSHGPGVLFSNEMPAKSTGKNQYDVWDEHVAVICQIEDQDGVDNIEEICATPGVDALFVGTNDLRLELGYRHAKTGVFDGEEEYFNGVLEKISAAAAKHGPNGMCIFGVSNMGPDLPKRLRFGWRAFLISQDSIMVHEYGKKDFAKATAIAKETLSRSTRYYKDEYQPAKSDDSSDKKSNYLPTGNEVYAKPRGNPGTARL